MRLNPVEIIGLAARPHQPEAVAFQYRTSADHDVDEPYKSLHIGEDAYPWHQLRCRDSVRTYLIEDTY